MLRFSKRKIAIYMLMLSLASMSLYGCNNNDEAEIETTDDSKVSDDQALQNAVAEALGDNANADDAGNGEAAEANPDVAQVSAATATPQAVAERSPVEITRVEVPNDPDDDLDSLKDGTLVSDKDEHEHEVTPNLFPVNKCQVEVQGIYKVKLAKDLMKEINSRRADRNIGPLAANTGLHACADARCKEQTYFIGHFRPDGTAFDSVGPGYVQGECIAVDYRTVNDIMEAWFAVNESRYQIMNPDYTQVGISIYDIDDIYYIAAEFGY